MTRTTIAYVFWSFALFGQLPLLSLFARQATPSYPYCAGLGVIALVILLIYRWDRKINLPTGIVASCLTLAGLFIGGTAGFLQVPILASYGTAFTLTGFLASHQDRRQPSSLMSAFPVVICLVMIPASLLEWTDGLLVHVIRTTSSNILNYLSVPHLLYDDVICLPATKIYFEQYLQGFQGWQFYVAFAMIFSAILRRTIAETFANILIAITAFAVSHIFVICWTSWFQFWRDGLHANFSSKVILYSLLIPVTLIFYFSLERLFRWAIAEIPDGPDDSAQVNFFVIAFNWLSMPVSVATGNMNKVVRYLLAVILVFMLLGQANSFVLNANTHRPLVWLPQVDVLQELQSNDSSFDFSREFSHEGEVSSVWHSYSPTERTVITVSRNRANPITAYTDLGWVEMNDEELKTQPNDQLVLLRRKSEYALLFNSKLSMTSGKPQLENTDGLYSVQCFISFLRQPTEKQIETKTQEFSKLVELLQANLTNWGAGTND